MAAVLLGMGLVLVTGPSLTAQTPPADGSLDTTFSSDGKVATAVSSNDDTAYGVAVQSDGKIVAAGVSRGSNRDFAVVRYNTNGSLDTSFSSDGKVTTGVGTGNDWGRSVAVQSDGKIVVAGYSVVGSNINFAVVRYNSNGSLDTSFDSDGKVTTAVGSGDDYAYSVAVQSDGKIVVAGYSHNGSENDFAVVRYNSNGSLDTSFSSDGMATTAVGSNNDYAYSVAVDSDGKIVVAGESNNGSNDDFAVVRYNSNGSLDTGFSSDGKVRTAIGSRDDVGRSVAVASDGKIVVAGESHNGTNRDFAVVRYNADGSLDSGFSSDGKVTTAVGSGLDAAYGVVVRSDGKIVAAGQSYDGTTGVTSDTFAVVRYDADGSLDTGFDSDGKVTVAVRSHNDYGKAVAMGSDGKIVVAGESLDNNGNDDFGVVRLHGGLGTPPPSPFDGDGTVTTAIGTANEFAFAVAVQDDDKIVAAGYSNNGSNDEFAVVRYNADGSLDTGFGSGGKVTTAIGSEGARGSSVAVQSDGKIVVAGYSNSGNGQDVAVVRYNADGSLDTSFDSDGKVTTDVVSGGDDFANSVAVQSDGKIVVAGTDFSNLVVVRYNADGSLDTSFDSDGKVQTNVGSDADIASGVAVQSDGKIVAAGESGDGTSTDIVVVRYNADGSLDTSFDGDGKVTTALGSRADSGRSVAVQSDGKIVVAGFSIRSSRDFAVVRYNADGSLDTSFDSDGKVTTGIGSGPDQGESVALLSDGRIVVAGYSSNGSDDDFAAVIYRTDGSLETGFGSGGKVTAAVGPADDRAYSVALQSDGRIVAAGATEDDSTGTTNWDFALVRWDAPPPLPPPPVPFDSDGKVTTPVSDFYDDGASGVAVQDDGKIVAAGYSRFDFAVVRYNADGSLDTGFGSGGKVTTAVSSGEDIGRSVAVQVDGKIVVAGGNDNVANSDFLVVRYNADGSLDTSFDGDGKVVTDVGSGLDFAHSVAVDSDGKIVAAGLSGLDFAVVRYNADGSLDTSFDGDGKVVTDVGASSADSGFGVALQSDGKIVVAGYSNNGSTDDFAVVRYNADGSLDTSFDGDGKVTTAIGSGADIGRSVALQSDGRIVVAGFSSNGSTDDFAVVRYNADGSLDTSFDGDGKVTTAVGNGNDFANGVALLSGGRIVVAGYSHNGTDFDFAAVLYRNDGSLDTGFDTDGKVTTAVGTGDDFANGVALLSDGTIVAAGESHNDDGNIDFALVRWGAPSQRRPQLPGPTLTPPTLTPPTPPSSTARVSGFELDVRRIGGSDRFETSVLLAREYAAIEKSLDAVVLVSGRDFPDALSASALAGVLDAPLLYTEPDRLPEQVAEFIRDNGVARVWIVGGEAAVSAQVESDAAALASVREVTRLSGADRYETSVEVASRVAASGVGGWCGDGDKTVLLANGAVFADALSASPAAAAGPHPLLLTLPGALPPSVAAWLAGAAEAGIVEQVVIVGGTAAVSGGVQDGIDAMGLATVRIAGADRYDTSARFAARTECIAKNHLAVSRGDHYADGLGAGPLMARVGGALVLVQPGAVPEPVATYAAATRRFRSDGEGTVWILGGRAAVSNAVLSNLRGIIRDANTP